MNEPRHPPGAAPDPSTAPTRPAMHAPAGYASPEQPIEVRTKEQDAILALQEEHPGAPVWGLTILVKTKSTEEAVNRLEKGQADHEKRLGVLERPLRPQQVTLHDLEESDVETRGALSADQRLQSIERAAIRNRKDQRRATNTQTAAIIGALIALATAGSQYLAAQARETAAATERAAERAAREATTEAAKAATKGTP